MTAAQLPVTFLGLADSLAAVLKPLAERASRALDLAEDVSGIRICADDLPGAGGAWYRLGPGQSPDALPVLVLFCDGECFGSRAGSAHAVQPPRPVWEQTPAPVVEPDAGGGFSPERSEMFLHHHLLTARDLVRGDLVGRNIPASLVEAFSEAWAVGVDGRLVRLGLPGYPLAERRGCFAGVFSPAGILLPDHWQVFQSLWDGALAGQKEVLEVVKRLPGL